MNEIHITPYHLNKAFLSEESFQMKSQDLMLLKPAIEVGYNGLKEYLSKARYIANVTPSLKHICQQNRLTP